MAAGLNYHKRENIGYLVGVLDCQTLAPLWQQRRDFFSEINRLDLTQLERVDSAGLALLTCCCLPAQITLTGITQQLKTLINLYDLETVLTYE